MWRVGARNPSPAPEVLGFGGAVVLSMDGERALAGERIAEGFVDAGLGAQRVFIGRETRDIHKTGFTLCSRGSTNIETSAPTHCRGSRRSTQASAIPSASRVSSDPCRWKGNPPGNQLMPQVDVSRNLS